MMSGDVVGSLVWYSVSAFWYLPRFQSFSGDASVICGVIKHRMMVSFLSVLMICCLRLLVRGVDDFGW